MDTVEHLGWIGSSVLSSGHYREAFRFGVIPKTRWMNLPVGKKVGSSNKKLCWRSICELLAKDRDLHVFGDLWDSVDIYGLDPWAEALVKCSFVIDEDSYLNQIMELFMGFEDDEIRELTDQLGGQLGVPDDDEGFENYKALEDVARAAKEFHFLGKPLSSILKSIGLQRGTALETIAERINALETEEHIQSLFDLVESGADRFALDKQWSKVINGPRRGMPTTLILANLWLSSVKKPSCISGHMHGEWAVLRWLLGGPQEILALFSELKKSNTKQAEEFALEVMKMGKEVARYYFERPYRFVGGAMAPLGRHIAQTKVKIALDCQGVLDQLEIRFDPEYRIGDMPYFNVSKNI